MIEIIVLNGPPGSGKNTIAEILEYELPCSWYRASLPLKRALSTLTGLSYDLLEEYKDEPMQNGYTPRQLYIALSEDLLKPKLGNDWFGKLLAKEIVADIEAGWEVFVVDCGFAEELTALIEEVQKLEQPFNIRLVHIKRQGCDFSSDSRQYIFLPDLSPNVLENDGEISDLLPKLKQLFPHLEWL